MVERCRSGTVWGNAVCLEVGDPKESPFLCSDIAVTEKDSEMQVWRGIMEGLKVLKVKAVSGRCNRTMLCVWGFG